MSIEWMARVWRHAKDVRGTELNILLAIADIANDSGRAWPSVPTLSDRARCTARSVQFCLIKLEEKGWLRRDFRTGHSTVYQLLAPEASFTPPPKPASPPQILHPEASFTTTPEADFTPPLKPASPRTIKEPSVEPSVGGGGVLEVTTESSVQVLNNHHPLPRWATAGISELGGSGTQQDRDEWQAAWDHAHAIREHANPDLSMTRFLDYHRDQKRTPTPADFRRWFVGDEREEKHARDKAALEVAASRPPAYDLGEPWTLPPGYFHHVTPEEAEKD